MPQEVEQVQTSAPVGWSGKMSPELSAPTKERTLGQSSRKQSKSQSRKSPLFLSLRTDGQQPDASPMWEENGALLGAFSMLSFGECPSAENASHLSQILEASPHPKYSLSAKACLGIVRRAERRAKSCRPCSRRHCSTRRVYILHPRKLHRQSRHRRMQRQRMDRGRKLHPQHY